MLHDANLINKLPNNMKIRLACIEDGLDNNRF